MDERSAVEKVIREMEAHASDWSDVQGDPWARGYVTACRLYAERLRAAVAEDVNA